MREKQITVIVAIKINELECEWNKSLWVSMW